MHGRAKRVDLKDDIEFMLVSRCQKEEQRQSIKIGNRSFESVANSNIREHLQIKIIFMKRL
jgi:hypothetical protein